MQSQPFFVPAVLFILLAIPLILGLMPRNWGYGIRTRKTLSDDRSWYPANRFGGWAILVSSVIYLVVAVLFPDNSGGVNLAAWLIHLAAFVLPLLISLLLVRAYIDSL